MKKLLLLAAIALVSVSASAVNGVKKAPIVREQKSFLVSRNTAKNIQMNQTIVSELLNSQKKNSVSAAATRADNGVELLPAISERVYIYLAFMGGELQQSMYDEASFLVTDDGKAYLAPYEGLGSIEGTLNEEAENEYADDGAVVYTFTSGVIASSTNKETSEKTNLSLEPATFTGSSEEGWTPVRSGEKTFNAYYFAEYNELYIPLPLCLFDADDASNTDIYDESFLVDELDLVPESDIQEYISKGTFSYKSYFDETTGEGDCVIYLAGRAFYIKGADPANPEAWVEYAYDSEDQSLLHVEDYQYVEIGQWYNDTTRTDTHKGVIVTMSTAVSEGTITGWSPNSTSDFTVTDTEEETSVITAANNTAYGDYVFMDEGYKGGNYEQVDQVITILYEPVADGIQSVGVESSAKFQNAIYNMAGQRVGKNFKGLVIKNGKKVVVK